MHGHTYKRTPTHMPWSKETVKTWHSVLLRLLKLSAWHRHSSVSMCANDERGATWTTLLHLSCIAPQMRRGEDKERRRNRAMASSHRMNNGLSLLPCSGGTVPWLLLQGITIITPGHGGKRKDQKKGSAICLMHDGFNVWSNHWNITPNKKW